MASSSGGQTVEFYYDISCPFAYVASTRISALAARTGAHISYCPVLLGAIYRLTAAPQGAAGSASDVFNSTKRNITSLAFRRTLDRHGTEYNEPPKHPMKTTAPLRLLYHVTNDERIKLTAPLFHIVRRAKINNVEMVVKAIEDGSFEGPSERQQLETATNEAVKKGAPGVPGFWIPALDRLYWGQDRMHFLEADLMLLNQHMGGEDWNRVERPLQSLIPSCRPSKQIPGGEQVKLEFWYDFSSPWAFLGWTQLARLKRQFGEKLEIAMKPFLLGILFREIGAPNTPMKAVSEQKRNYSTRDHGDWCRWWNAVNKQDGMPDNKIEFHWADIFPIRTPNVLRAALVEPELVGVLFRACWERNLDMASDKVLHQVITEAGYDADRILTSANESKFKNELRARTKEAKEVGLCGVPSYRVFRKKLGQEWKQVGDIVWGQDELAVVEDLIAGWNGKDIAKLGHNAQPKL